MKVLKREEINEKDTWCLEDIYANDEAFNEEFSLVQKKLVAFQDYEGQLNQQATLLACLKDYEDLTYLVDRLMVYASQRSHQDTKNAYYMNMLLKVYDLMVVYNSTLSFFEPEILSIDEASLNAWLLLDAFKPYVRFISSITRMKEHVLDAKTEALLARSANLNNADNIFSMFNDADIRFDDIEDKDGKLHPLTIGSYVSYMESEDIVLRRNAFHTLYKHYAQFNNTLAAIYSANVKETWFNASEHGYGSSLEAALFQNEIPPEVYDQLLASIHRHFKPMHDYVAYKKEALGLDEIHMYDIYVPTTTPSNATYSFEQAKAIVKEGLQILGDDYIAILEEGFQQRWIDIYENENKRTGAYSWGCYGTHPYVLLNYQGTLYEVFTLAHEMGHAIHTYHSNKAQRQIDAGYKIFVAEVASTCNEALLIHYLMDKTTDVNEKRYLVNYFVDQFRATMYRQALFAEFEKITHEESQKNIPLTGEHLNQVYLELNKQYFGDTMMVDDDIQYEWSRIPHFYTPFYVYQYATGFAAAIAIANKILNHEEGILEKYKQFLSGGCSQNPIALLKICGVDMSSNEPIEDALQVFEDYLAILKSL